MVQNELDDLSPTLADLAEIEWQKAFEQGLEQGLEKSKKNVALAMLDEGSEVDFIAKEQS